ncbi:putative pollen-specific leucine-rich repeat extensin-like protein 3 [Iris pallida]|uniref:Pollen-specific leucine-rich repeat extensin-like protein 3 n=1 Tax=Iris pallida TaxID=29817 RepID=A0AAX6HVR9_IRIPA|nr:putative pollen-specific leucine-rich repeat extensin-like protein 3 [Iris pallida]
MNSTARRSQRDEVEQRDCAPVEVEEGNARGVVPWRTAERWPVGHHGGARLGEQAGFRGERRLVVPDPHGISHAGGWTGAGDGEVDPDHGGPKVEA